MTERFRVRIGPVNLQVATDNVFVEEHINGAWVTRWSTNELSNDFAYTEAKNRKRLLEQQHEHNYH